MKILIFSLLLLPIVNLQASDCEKFVGKYLENLSVECKGSENKNFLLCLGAEKNTPRYLAGTIPTRHNSDLKNMTGATFYDALKKFPFSDSIQYLSSEKGRVVSYVYNTVHKLKINLSTLKGTYVHSDYMKLDHKPYPEKDINLKTKLNCRKL